RPACPFVWRVVFAPICPRPCPYVGLLPPSTSRLIVSGLSSAAQSLRCCAGHTPIVSSHPLYLSMVHIATPRRGMVATVPSPSLPCFMTSRMGPTEYSAYASGCRYVSTTQRKLQAGLAYSSGVEGAHGES